ncbi:MAG: hypothetical protein N2688_05455 [Burkholderiaceae bacterium]|nr:hypothetical protein [Burkholderiaceae bacterium]
MADARDPKEVPLASFVLRVRGQPARLRFELLDVRSGERRSFSSLAKLTAHLRTLGLDPNHVRLDTSDDA